MMRKETVDKSHYSSNRDGIRPIDHVMRPLIIYLKPTISIQTHAKMNQIDTLREVTLAFVLSIKQFGQVLGTKVDTPNLW